MNKLTRRSCIALVTLSICARAELPPEKLRRIEQVLATEMARASIPGISLTIATGGAIQWSGGFGMADLENFVPMTAASELRLASISKTITAVAVLQLAEAGKLDLDAPIQRYAPEFPQKPWPVTIRHLLSHTAGVRHYKGVEMNSTDHYTDLISPMKVFAADPLLFEPGTQYSYTTYGFTLLGAAVERASGMKLIDYFREKIFKPAGMDHIGLDSVYDLIPHRVRGYALRDGKVQNCLLSDTSNKIPGGGLISRSEDLVKFVLALNRGELLKKETLEKAWTRQTLRDGKLTSYGLGFEIRTIDGNRVIGHTGGQRGTQTNMILLPEKGIAIGMMLNLEATPVLIPLTKGIAAALLEP